jgi:ABC-type nitrate/sulfonate/bicarbonate transport system substrate-binding protein
MTTKDVQIVSILETQQELAFKQGRIDALVTYEPNLSKLQG